MFLYFLGFVACALIIFIAAKITYTQVQNIAEAFDVPAFLVSILLVALSTSTPELFVGVSSALRGVPAFSLGDIFGANILNLTLIAGLVILLSKKPLNLQENISLKQLMITFSIASVPVFLILDGTLSRIDGAFLFLLYVLYIRWVIKKHRTDNVNLAKPHKKDVRKAVRSLFFFAVGITILLVGSEAIISLASSASKNFYVAPFAIGVFAVALSTTLPELMFGVRVALESKPELSAGDLIGSSIANAAGVLGIVAIIHPIVPLSLNAVLFTGFFGIFVFLVYFLSAVKKEIPRTWGAWLVLMYIIFASFNFIVESNYIHSV